MDEWTTGMTYAIVGWEVCSL